MTTLATKTQRKRGKPWSLIVTLGTAGIFSGLLLVTIYRFTQPIIQENQVRELEAAIYRVLPGAIASEAFVLSNGELVHYPGEGLPLQDAVFAGFDSQGRRLGFAIPSEGPGFQDTIRLIYGYHPENRLITGMQILESRETPGLGDKIFKDEAFVRQFQELSAEPALQAVTPGTRKAANEVDTISGATISAVAVVRIINRGRERWLPAIEKMLGQAGEN